MKGADLFVKCLENEGVKYIFGIPGEENLDLLDSLKDSEIKFITTRHEQAAAFMAATYGRLTGKAGVVLSTLGPGATNLMTGIAHAQLGAMPLVAITAEKSAKDRQEGKFQKVEVIKMMQSIVKESSRVDNGASIAGTVRAAFYQAENGRPGVVHIELPEDVAAGTSEVDTPLPAELSNNYPNSADISNAAAVISAANKPLVVVGSGANHKNISASLTDFIKTLGVPFISTQMGKGAVDERLDNCLGCPIFTEGQKIHEIVNEADLIVSIGYGVYEKPPFIFSKANSKLLSINSYPTEDAGFTFEHEVVGDIPASLKAVIEKVEQKNYWKGNSLTEFKVEEVKGGQHELFTESNLLFGGELADQPEYELDPYEAESVEETPNHQPISIEHLVHSLRTVISKNGIVCLDNGLYKLAFAEKYKAYKANSLILDNALATMGAGLPTATVAKMLNPSSQVVAVVGDGGFMMNSQEIETMMRLGVAVKILLLEDKSFGMIEWKQEHLGLKENGLKFENPDWELFAKSYGIAYTRLGDPDTLQGDLRKGLMSRKAAFMHMVVDYTEAKSHLASATW
ncbi:MAG: thiamine pyrophosphate-binding protein [Candidatus Dojkabacteria bacterium]|nr:MAG: thiamine pyrophosphate-binding protein [Candidatus Dojkabacteria bacterium]